MLFATDRAGTVVERYEYSDFGAPVFLDAAGALLTGTGGAPITASRIGNDVLWQGAKWHADIQLYYFRYRWYDPHEGRFLTPDPLGTWGDPVNLGNDTVFPGHNPWSYTDPYGLRGWAAECGADLRDWSNRTFPENAIGSLGHGVVHFVSTPLLLGEGTAEMVQGYEAYEGNGEKLSWWYRPIHGLLDVGGIAGGVGAGAKGVGAATRGFRALRIKPSVPSSSPGAFPSYMDEVLEAAREMEKGWPAQQRALTDSGDILNMAKPWPGPGGRLGGPDHRAMVDDVAASIRARGNLVDFEKKVPTPGGYKPYRFPDVIEIDSVTGRRIRYHQIGRRTHDWYPVARERRAIDDIYEATGIDVWFHPYN